MRLGVRLSTRAAQVTLVPADRISFQPHPVFDSNSFASLEELDRKVESEGFYGGVRLMMVRGPAVQPDAERLQEQASGDPHGERPPA